MPPRAPALSPEDRRTHLIAATIPLLRTHGRSVTTKDIALAAGVAEGTIFRVFSCKDDLVDEAVHAAFAPGQLLKGLAQIDTSVDLRSRLIALARLIQDRLIEVFDLMRALAIVVPPEREDTDGWRERFRGAALEIIGPCDELTIPPERLMHYLRLLTFAGSHREIAEGSLLSPEEIVDVILDGTRKDT